MHVNLCVAIKHLATMTFKQRDIYIYATKRTIFIVIQKLVMLAICVKKRMSFFFNEKNIMMVIVTIQIRRFMLPC